MKSGTKRPMSAFLPPTPCLPEMRERLLSEAKRQGKSIAELQREAVSLFLSRIDSNCIKDVSEVIKEEQAS